MIHCREIVHLVLVVVVVAVVVASGRAQCGARGVGRGARGAGVSVLIPPAI